MANAQLARVAVAAAASQTFAHHALIYGSVGELLATAVPFLTEGLAAGQGAVLVCWPPLAREIVAAIGRDAPLRIIDPDDVYTGAARAVAAVRRLALDRDAGRAGVRIVGSVPLAGSPDDRQEWSRYEAAINTALEPLRLSCVCAYDGRDLPVAARTVIGRTHPLLRTAHGATPNPDFLDPVTFLRMSTPVPSDPTEVTAPDVTIPAIEDVYDLDRARSAIRAVLARTQIGKLTVGDLTAAAGELLANAVRHGRPPAQLRLWIRPDRLICSVRDRGGGFDDPLAGYLPPPEAGEHGGTGLWLARQTCDRLEMRSDGDGFNVCVTIFRGRRHGNADMASLRARAEHARARAHAARARARELAERLRKQQNALAGREQHRWEVVDQADEMVRCRRHAPASREAQTG
jgi:anti-sigma regulatory factor (Ser/Thr protein kinase)